MPESNADRQIRGNAAKNVLGCLLNLCVELGYISTYEANYSIGKPEYSDQNQFRAHYLIKFPDNAEWIVFSTTSLRDRIKANYWDAFNIKELNPMITDAYLVYPDSISQNEKNTFIRKSNKIQNYGEFSPLTALLSQNKFFNTIETHALQGLTDGQRRDKKGNNFEKRLAFILSNQYNFEKWKNQDKIIDGFHYTYYEETVSFFGLDREAVKKIEATSDKNRIGYLPSGGPSKTDILVTVTYNDNSCKYYTISCKRSNNANVSIHQYSADSFADVLAPNNLELRRLLQEFQQKGNLKDMDANDKETLANILQPYILPLCKWALGGIGGEGNPDTQWANYLFVYDDDTEAILKHTTEEYCYLLSNNCTRSFKTPFSWTYQGTRGSNIQLKCPIKL